MQVTNHLNNIRKIKEEMLEAIYGTVERLEQKVDELSASPKYAGAETVPASNDTTKLEKSIIAMFGKEEEVRGKISKLRDAIVVFVDLIKAELGKNEQRSKLLVDAVKQMRQENDVSSKALQDKLEVMNNSPQKKLVTHRFEPTSKYVLLFIGGLALSLVLSIWGNLTQWREHQDWEKADLKYRALKMVLPSDDPNVRYIEKNFSIYKMLGSSADRTIFKALYFKSASSQSWCSRHWVRLPQMERTRDRAKLPMKRRTFFKVGSKRWVTTVF